MDGIGNIKCEVADNRSSVCGEDACMKQDPGAKKSKLLYKVNDVPPWYLCIFLAFQHYLVMFISTAATPLIFASAMCLPLDGSDICDVINSMFFVSGLTTILQSSVGVRLPIVQGASFSFLLPLFAILTQPRWKCPDQDSALNITNISSGLQLNSSEINGAASINDIEPWKERMQEIQGSLMVASALQIIMGAAGIIQFTLKFIGPITVAPTMALIGLSLFEVAADTCALNWAMSILTILLITICAQYLTKVTIPLCMAKPGYHRSRSDIAAVPIRLRLPLLTMFSLIIPMLLVWFLCYILTVTGVLGDVEDSWGYHARTDLKVNALYNTAWVRVPYPFQWGMPSASLGGILGMIAGTWASIVESIGNYYACAMIAGAPPPPNHAINRGILVDGIGCLMSGMWGTGVGSTSYGSNIAVLGITRVGSRRVMQVVGVILVILALFGKLGALFVMIPSPILGGTFMIMFGVLVGVAISALEHVDITSSRNLYILGTSILLGLSIPHWLSKNPGIINTGVGVLDQIITVLLATGMFLAGVTAFIMDNTIPGTEEERGLHVWKKVQQQQEQDADSQETIITRKTYGIPCMSKYKKQFSWTRYLPFCPGFRGFNCVCCSKRSSNDMPL